MLPSAQRVHQRTTRPKPIVRWKRHTTPSSDRTHSILWRQRGASRGRVARVARMLPSARCSVILRPARFLIHRRSFRAPTTALNHCVEVVRQQDRERFLCNTCARFPAPRKHFCHPHTEARPWQICCARGETGAVRPARCVTTLRGRPHQRAPEPHQEEVCRLTATCACCLFRRAQPSTSRPPTSDRPRRRWRSVA